MVSLVVLVALASLLMVSDRRLGYLHNVRAGTLDLLRPLHQIVDWPSQWGSGLAAYLGNRHELIEQLQQSERELLHARAEATQLRTQQQMLARVQALLQASENDPAPKLVASILAVDLDPYSRRFLMNRGRKDGVVEGAVLFDGYGLVGQVVELGTHTARAMMLSDISQAIPVEIERTGGRAIANGTGDATILMLDDLPINIDLQVGDVLRSSGLGGIYPRGYLVATISSVIRTPTARYARAEARASAQLDHIDEVLVLPPVIFEGPPEPP